MTCATPPSVGAVILKQAPVHLVTHAAPFKDAAPVKQQVENIRTHIIFQSRVHGAYLRYMFAPVLRVFFKRLKVLGCNLCRFGIACFTRKFACLAHFKYFSRLHCAKRSVTPDELGQGSDHDFVVPYKKRALKEPFLKRLCPTDIYRKAFCFLPGFVNSSVSATYTCGSACSHSRFNFCSLGVSTVTLRISSGFTFIAIFIPAF